MPSNLQALLILLFFIAPGFLFSQAHRYRRPRYYREPNLFRQTVTAIIASTLIHTLLLLLLSGIALICMAVLGFSPPLSELIKPLLDYSTEELTRNLMILAGYAILSLVIGWRGGLAFQRALVSEIPNRTSWLVRTLLGLRKEQTPLWWMLIGQEVAEGREPHLKVRLCNGDECVGNVGRLRWIGEKDVVFELILKDVSYARAMGKGKEAATSQAKRLPGHRLLLLSSDILWLSRIDVPFRELSA